MKSFDIKEAADFLKMSASTLQRKAAIMKSAFLLMRVSP
jgi:hypothetical protein